ncbi:MAG: hypothetical protein M1816_001784 [Peltula sp. TS41687]|nr:MAG: hypothetical protein M1816_001784 [Peltula sp. TS41687]
MNGTTDHHQHQHQHQQQPHPYHRLTIDDFSSSRDEKLTGNATLGDGLRTFDAFPKTKTHYTTRHARGGQWTIVLLLLSGLLTLSELRRWHAGHESHHYMVEKGVGHTMQINLDVVVAMHCDDLHVNVQDASGDLILAGQMLVRDETAWRQWRDVRGVHRLGGEDDVVEHYEEHVNDMLGMSAGSKNKGRFEKTPRLRGGAGAGDACRIYGSMELNRVQGDFHITARGHGYMEFGEPLDHSAFNFSHLINELSFGPFYPSLHNPLDATVATTDAHFYKFQYYLSIVPTVYSSATNAKHPTLVFSNQYAVTEQSHLVGERAVPGVFFKFDVEPIMLLVSDDRAGLLKLLARIVSGVSGVLVAGGWCYQFWDFLVAGLRWRGRGRGGREGVLHGRLRMVDGEDEEE